MPSISGVSTSRGDSSTVLSPQKGISKADKEATKAEKEAANLAAKAEQEAAEAASDPVVSVVEEPVVSPVTEPDASAVANNGKKKGVNALGSKFDSLATDTNTTSDDDASSPPTTVTVSKEVVDVVGTTTSKQSSDAVKVLRNDFNKQFADLQARHEAEMSALLDKFNDVSEQLKTLSEQSAEQITVLKDQLGGLGGQLGTIINKLDLFGGGNLSLRSIGLFNVAAQAGDGALDKLIKIIGPNSTGNQLRSVQSRLQSVSSRFGGGQTAAGLNLLA